MKIVTPLFALLVVASIGLAPSLAAGACDIGGHNETSENFNPGGWVLTPGTPGGGPAVTGTHLLISEVAPRGGGAGTFSDSSEYVEIVNPTSQLVVLGNHYLSDASNYYTVVNGPVTVAFNSDYVLRFPTFAYLNPGQRAVICVTKQGYFASGNPPPGAALFLEMKDSNSNSSDDMIIMSPASVFPLSGGMLTNPSGTNGEWVVLFCWDGTTDRVCDVDYASWGANSSPANSKVDKTGVCIDGPDGDAVASCYNPDTPAAGQSNLGNSTVLTKPNTYQRSGGEVGEATTGGNGCRGVTSHPFANTHAVVDLVGPMGPETWVLNGQSTCEVNDSNPVDSDFNGREQVPIEMIQLDLTGGTPLSGPVHVRLRSPSLSPNQHSTGEIEENTNLLPGHLDVPPGGSSFFDVFFEVEVQGLTFHNLSPAHVTAAISDIPPATGEQYVSLQHIDLYDESNNLTPYFVQRIVHIPVPPVERDTFPNTCATIDIQLPGGGVNTVDLTGPSIVNASIGNIGDNDFDGREEVATELVSMSLTGTSNPLGPVAVRLRPAAQKPFTASLGQMEELVNNTVNTLDTPPLAPSGASDSFFDVFFEVDLGGQTYHNAAPLHLATVITRKPPARDETFTNTNTVELLDANNIPTGIHVVRTLHTPYWVERDTFPNSKLVIEVFGPLGPETLTLKGPTRVEVGMGEIAGSPGTEHVPTQMVEMSATGASALYGPVTARLRPETSHPFMRTVGEIEENANVVQGRLDLPPFAPGGTASSFFDVFFEVEVAGQTYHNDTPKHMAGQITHKPPTQNDQYDGDIPIPLYDNQHQPAPFSVGHVIHIPYDVKTTAVPVPGVPNAVAIQDIRPNPTTGATTITLALPRRAKTRLVAYDLNGRLVRTLFSGTMEAGVRPISWDGRSDRGEKAPGGIYFIRLESADRISVRKLVILN